jgi:hypothetical protein
VSGTGHPAPGARYQIQSDAEGWMLNTEDRGGVPENAPIGSASMTEPEMSQAFEPVAELVHNNPDISEIAR